MTQQPVCIICGNKNTTLLQEGARHDPEVKVHRCRGCGFVFLWPRPTPAELDAYYATEYREDYGGTPAGEQYQKDLAEAETRVERLQPLLAAETRLLEIGSGSGAFLNKVRGHCGSVTGVEPHDGYREATLSRSKINMYATLDEAIKDGRRFDVVVMFHVLEHIEDPAGFLQKASRVMDKGARLGIEVPNVDDALVSVYQVPAYLEFYYQKAHLYYYSAATLAAVLEAAGFAADINGVQRYDLSNHLRWMLTGKPGGHGYYRDIFAPRADAAYADALIRSGHQDTLWAIATKKDEGNERHDG